MLFRSTKLVSCLFGVTYSILIYDFAPNEPMANTIAAFDETAVQRKALDTVYAAMFKKRHYENDVSLWEVDEA